MNLSYVMIVKGKCKKKYQGRPRENTAPAQGERGRADFKRHDAAEDSGSGTKIALGGRSQLRLR